MLVLNNLPSLRKLNVAFLRYGVLALALLLAMPLSGQSPAAAAGVEGPHDAAPQSLAGFPWDWSHHHLIFSAPASAERAAELQQEPRYLHQASHRAAQAAPAAPESGGYFALLPSKMRRPSEPQGLWGASLGTTGGTVGTLNYPAKYSFTGGVSCNDYVAFNTSLAGAAATAASQTGTFTLSSGTGTVVVDGVTLTASPGTAASQSTTISSNGVASGNAIKITNGASSLTLTASTPIAASQTGTFTASSGTGTVVVDGVTLTASPGTAASQSTTIGTLTLAGASGKTITVAGTVYTASAPVAASQTGTFTASSGSGTVAVNGTTLTASPGTAASRSTTVGTLTLAGASGKTITVAGTVYTASAPTAAISPILINNEPSAGDTITINTTVYDFQSSTSSCIAGDKCVQLATSTTTQASNLNSAIAGTCYNGSCGADPTVTASPSSATVTITAITPGTGANLDTLATSHTSRIHLNGQAISSTTIGANSSGQTGTPGTDGSNTSPSFQWWSGAAALSGATVATNIISAITGTPPTGVVASTGGSGIVALTASATGLAGNSIAVSTTITSGLTGGAFAGNLSNGTSGTTSGTTFSTSTDSATQSTNLQNEASALASAINTNFSASLTATSSGAVVTVTDETPGSSGNSITLTGTVGSTFGWTTGTLINGSDGSNTSPSFQWWSGAAALSGTTVATNIIGAINGTPPTGVVASSGGSGIVTLTASATGLAGNSIAVSTTITSGLTGGAFTNNLSGGAAGTTSGTTFSTSTDSATPSTNLQNEATALASAINTSISALTATSAGAVVTVTDKTAGSSGNSITLTGTLNSTFGWTTGTLLNGSDGSNISPNFQWWSGSSAASAATLATNIATAIGSAAAVGVGATNPSSGVVKITASATGLAGNSITVSTTISSGLAASAFNGSLSGGAAGTTSGTTFLTSTDSATQATNLANEAAALASAINANVSALTATSAGAVVTLTDKTPGAAGNSITLTGTLNSTFSWASGTLASGADGQASIVAFNNIYSGTCTGTVPSVAWSYNTGGTISTSVVLSFDGSQVAFIHTPTSGASSLVILHWHAGDGTVTAPAQPASESSAANYATCRSGGAACMYVIAFGNAANDATSSPFYDYANDILYVGDSAGRLHKFTGVFNGSPAETGGSWPIAVSNNKLTSPVLDSKTGDIFVADSGGFLYSYLASSAAKNGVSSQLAATGGTGIFDAPLVDSSNGYVFVWVEYDGNVTTGKNCAAVGCNGVFRFLESSISATGTGLCASTNGTSWTTGTICGSENVLGQGTTTGVLYDGTPDNAYYTGTGATGNIWTCSFTAAQTAKLIYSTAANFGAVVSIGNDTYKPLSTTASCSPVTEILNGSTDYIYLSSASGGGTGLPSPPCTGGCVYGFTVSGTTPTISAGLPASGGSSGIVIDNTASGGGSQVYFSYLSNATSLIPCPSPSGATGGGCAVQASQSLLK